MNKIGFAMLLIALMIGGCRSAEQPAGTERNLKIFYDKSTVPSNTYRVIKKSEITVTNNLFTNVNARVHEEIKSQAAKAKADAVIVGEINRAQCECSSCRKHGENSGGNHVVVEITLLQLQTP